MIRTAQVISDASAEDEVGMNNTVTVEMLDDGSVEKYRIVTTVRGNSLEGLISNESPWVRLCWAAKWEMWCMCRCGTGSAMM